MRLYHGSKKQSEFLKSNQATAPSDPELAKLIPEKELLNAVYFTPDFEFALAMGARPEGVTDINITDEHKTIKFQHPELFDPEQIVYIYEVDDRSIPKEHLEKVDERQYAYTGTEQVKPLQIQQLKARELSKYFKFENWRESKETEFGTKRESGRYK